MAPSAPEAWPAQTRAVGTLLAGCKIEAVLHVGPVCTVYRAGDALGVESFVLKEYCPQALCVRADDGTPVLRDPGDAAARAAFDTGRGAFMEELRLLARLQLPGLVPVLQASDADGGLCGVMPLLPGVTLDRRPPPRSDEALRELLLSLLEPLAALHGAGLVHGALHARQLLWARGERPVLLGFSLAARALRLPQVFEGAAPELRPEGMHLPRGPWTDLYALAVTVLHHLTGLPWDAPDAPEDVAQALDATLGPAPDSPVRRLLVQALRAALKSSPTERPPSVAALRALLAGQTPRSRLSAPLPQESGRRTPPEDAAPLHAPGAGRLPPGATWVPPHPAEQAAMAARTAAAPAQPVAITPKPDAFKYVPPPAPPRASGRRRAVWATLVLMLGTGVAAWSAREAWQVEQERLRASRLVATAAVPGPAAALGNEPEPAPDETPAPALATAPAPVVVPASPPVAPALAGKPASKEPPVRQAARAAPDAARPTAEVAAPAAPRATDAAPAAAPAASGTPAAAPMAATGETTAAAAPGPARASSLTPGSTSTPASTSASTSSTPASTSASTSAALETAAPRSPADPHATASPPQPPAAAAVPSVVALLPAAGTSVTAAASAVQGMAAPEPRPPAATAAAPAVPAGSAAAAPKAQETPGKEKTAAPQRVAEARKPDPEPAARPRTPEREAKSERETRRGREARGEHEAKGEREAKSERETRREREVKTARTSRPATPPTRSARTASSPPYLPTASDSPAPRDACGMRAKYALLQCMQAQCGKASWRSHAQCQRLRQDNDLTSRTQDDLLPGAG